MNNLTVKSLANEIQTSVDCLVQQFADAGIQKTADDSVTTQEKLTLLAYLNREHYSVPKKLTLQRKTRSTLNILGTGGKSKLVQIEVRKKRIFVKRDQQEEIPTGKERSQSRLEVITKHKVECKAKHEVVKKIKQGVQDITKSNNIVEKNKVSNHQVDEITKTIKSKKSRFKSKTVAIELKHKAEAYKKHNIESTESNEDSTDYYMKVFHNTQNVHFSEEDSDCATKKIYDRNTKATRPQKKRNKYRTESKIDREEARATIRSSKDRKNKSSVLQQSFNKPIQAVSRDVIIGEIITVSELANKMAVKGAQVIKSIMKLGAMVTINQVIDKETAQLVAEEMGHKVIIRRENELEETVMNDRDTGIKAEPRAPIVTIMGHVDHGKTSLLDYIRSTKVAFSEAGGITQHIGAYHVTTNNGVITFLDTPGHAAFTSMRARGAQITDIIVLVVAADDGVMPQTVEAIQHAKAADVPIVVAINKIDKTEVNLDQVRNELAKYNILPEEWGGESQFVNVSAKLGTGVDELLDAILLQAEVLELKAIRKGMARGTVIESFLDKGRGPIATILVREGTLHKGDIVLCGLEYGRVRAMRNELYQEILEAGPSIPVEILGLSGVPVVGDEITVVRDEKKARDVALYRQGKFREVNLARQSKSQLKNIFTNINNGKIYELNIVIKADVQGSMEAICDSLLKLSTEETKIKIIGSGVGCINETDATLAAASNAILVGFNVRADASARHVIDAENLDLRYYSVIYNLIDEIKAAMISMISPEIQQKNVGLAEVRNVFRSPKFNAIAGCIVTEGTIKKNNLIRVLRNNIIIYEGELESLRRFKDDVNEVRSGMECGIGVKEYNDVRVGDIIEVFETIKIQRSID